jgi:hypothetical protein
MENNTLKNIFKFLEDEGEHKAPFKWKLENNIPLSKEDLKVEGNLNLIGSDIKSLPEGLEVGWDLYLDYTMINTLPKGLQVDGDLSITNNPLAKLSDETILSMIEPDGYINGDIIREDNG